MERGKFIVIEGPDGAGKTTQAKRLVSIITQHQLAAIYTRQPSDGPIGSLIRRRVVEGDWHPGEDVVALLFAADRMDHLRSEVIPALARGTHVVCDRYTPSSLAYQGIAQKQTLGWVAHLNVHAPAPDVTIVLDIDATTAAARRFVRPLERYDDPATQDRIVSLYNDLAGFAFPSPIDVAREDGSFTFANEKPRKPLRVEHINGVRDEYMVTFDICEAIQDLVRVNR